MAKKLSRPILFFALILSLASLCACGPSFEINDETLAAAVSDVFPLVEKETGVALAGIVTVRPAEADEIGAIVRGELHDQFCSIYKDHSRAEKESETVATLLTPMLFAKFAFEEKSILICPGNLDTISKALDAPMLRTPEGLRAILAHECVHAADEIRYGIAEQSCSFDSAEASQAFNAVIEGHAQFVSRKVCDAGCWTAAFDAFTHSIGAIPDDIIDEKEQGLLLLCQVLVQKVASAYYDGEEFIAALFDAGGADAVERAFRQPPDDPEVILHPEWYLDPSTRPVSDYDLDGGLDIVENRFDAEQWQTTRGNMTRPQIEAAISLLSKEEIEASLADLEFARYVMLQPEDAPQSKLVLAALYEFRSEEGAATCRENLDRLLRIKDEKMAEGQVRIVGQHYEPLGAAGVEGTFSEKEVVAFGNTMSVVSVIARKGDVCVELAFSAEAFSRADAGELVRVMLIAAGAWESE